MLIRLALLLLLFAGMTTGLRAQSTDISDYIPTDNVDKRKDSNKKKNAPKRRTIRYIVKNHGQGLLYGNPCMLEQTRRMGFEYAVQTPGLPGSLRPVKRHWDNVRTWMRLIVLKSPFWKMTLNKRVKDCRKKSGDLVG